MTLENPSLFKAMETALLTRQKNGVPVRDISKPMPCSAPDLFSNDYLSLSTDTRLRQLVLQRLSNASHIMGTTGTRPLCGSPSQLIALEERMQKFWDAPSALLCNSGYDANLAFFRSVPQATDIVIYDELVHASIVDGLKTSRVNKNALIPFSHNSLASLHNCIRGVIHAKPDLIQGNSGTTIFIALESAYSMDGDLAPLEEMVTLVEKLLPSGTFHIIVDEAHTTGIYGPQGKGFVSMLGLDRRIHTVLHTFGKGCGFFGAVLLTHPFIKLYLANYARPLIYSNSLPHCVMEGIHAILDYLSSPVGDELRRTLQLNAAYFQTRLQDIITNNTSQTLLTFSPHQLPPLPSATARTGSLSSSPKITSPIFPILTAKPIQMAKYLQSLGYDAQPIPYPAVPKGKERIRMIVHAGNTKKELDDMIEHLVEWITMNDEGVEGESEEEKVEEKQSLLVKELETELHRGEEGVIAGELNATSPSVSIDPVEKYNAHTLIRELITPFPCSSVIYAQA